MFSFTSLTLVDERYHLKLTLFSLQNYTLKVCFVLPQEVFIPFSSANVPFLEGQCKAEKGKYYFGSIRAPAMKAFKIAVLCTEGKQHKTLRLFFILVKYAYFSVFC